MYSSKLLLGTYSKGNHYPEQISIPTSLNKAERMDIKKKKKKERRKERREGGKEGRKRKHVTSA